MGGVTGKKHTLRHLGVRVCACALIYISRSAFQHLRAAITHPSWAMTHFPVSKQQDQQTAFERVEKKKSVRARRLQGSWRNEEQ